MKKLIIASLALVSVAATASAQDSFIVGWDFDGVGAAAPSATANWGDLSGTALATWTHTPAGGPPFFTPAEFGITGAANSAVVGNTFAFTDPNTGFSAFNQNGNTGEFGFLSNVANEVITLNFDASSYVDIVLTYAVDTGEGFSLVTENLVDGFSGNFDITTTAGTSYDNFAVTGTVVPEPSTYAAIAGALALGFVAYRRRK